MGKLASFLAALIALLPSFTPKTALPSITSPSSTIVYAPFVTTHEFIKDDAAVWHTQQTGSEHSTALLRKTFDLSQPLDAVHLHIFADTRYELWVDGVFVGRGPARFSRVRREYDRHALGTLAPGRHVVAVLVQWAPNTRRAESLRPELRAHIEGRDPAGRTQIVARSNESWRALAPDAWSYTSRRIHLWDLIGPSEILDLRRLPTNWQATDFDDSDWPAAAVLPPLGVAPTYAPRSIPFLDHATLRPALHDAGRVSPRAALLQSNDDAAFFSVSNAQSIVIDAFGSDLGIAPPTATLNAAPLTWNADPARPGVYSASAFIAPGEHRIDGLIDRAALLHAPFDDAVVAPPAASIIPAPGIRAALAQPDADIFQIDASSPYTYRLPGAASYVLFDLGQVRHGRLTFDVSGPSGTIIDVGWDERLQPGAEWILPHPGPLHREWSQVDSWTLDGAKRSVRTVDARTGRYVVVIAWDGPVTLADVHFEDERYPAVQTGSFSADAQLDAIWQTGVNTARINMVDAYADPWRERAQWWGDTFVVDRVNEVAFADTALLRRGLQAFADGIVDGRPPAFAPNNDGTLLLDYGMLWVQSFDSYLSRSAEEGFAQRIYPQMQDFLRFLAGYRAAGSALLDMPNLHWSESALIDFPAFYANVGTGGRGTAGLSTPVNAMYYGTLRAAARIAARLGRSADAARWNDEASQLRTTIHEQLYDAGSGCYASTIYAGIRGIPTVHAQGWALAYDVPPAESRTAVADCLLARVGPDPRAPGFGPYGTYWILEGLANADRTADGVSLVRRLYGAMLDRGATTWWETFTADDRYSSALSHGWGSAPTWFLSTRVLGVARDGAGNLSITPALDVLNYAKGSVPIDGGSIDVSWKRLSCEATELTVRLDAPARLRVPRSANVVSAWTERGRVSVESLRGGDEAASLALPQGTARFGVTHPCAEPK